MADTPILKICGELAVPLTAADMRRLRLRDELASAFAGGLTDMFICQIGIDPNLIAIGSQPPLLFWDTLIQRVERGIIAGPNRLERLLGEAAAIFPGNEHFRLYAGYRIEDQPVDNGGAPPPMDEAVAEPERLRRGGMVLMMAIGGGDVRLAIEQARQVGQSLNVSCEVVFVGGNRALLHLPNAVRIEDALDFAEAVSQATRDAGVDIRTWCSLGEYRDRLVNPLFVEGPDSARFEFNDVPGETTVEELGKALAGQYDKGVFAGSKGRPSTVTVDHVQDDGTVKRLEPGTTLNDNDVKPGDTLQVARESRAGAGVNPALRDQALARVKSQVVAYARANSGFGVSANSETAPTEYVLKFIAPSWGPPGPPAGPMPIYRHEVLIVLPGDFPVKAPEVFWQTPIFHPNIHETTGLVCLGALADRYRPGLDFGELCQMLVDMASFRNYAVEEGYNMEAQKWALRAWREIEERGGVSLLRTLITEQQKPTRELRIRRIGNE